MTDTPARWRVAIVGGGVMGRSLARACARAGFAATLFPGARAGASTVPAALLNPYRGRTGRAHPDDRAALAVTWRWARELAGEGTSPGAHRTGVVRIADGARQARSFASQPGLTPFPPEQAPHPYRAPHGGAIAADGGWLDPRAWLAALTASAVAGGAIVAAGWDVVALERPGGGGIRVVTSGGVGGVFDVVVLATGASPWPPGWRLATPPFEAVAGDAVVTGQVAPALPLAGGHALAPAAMGGGLRAAITGHHRPPGPPEADAAERLRQAVAWAWPDAPQAGVEAQWWGVRAHLKGNRPTIERLAPDVWWCGALAGRGFLAAAAVAEAWTARLVAGSGRWEEPVGQREKPSAVEGAGAFDEVSPVS